MMLRIARIVLPVLVLGAGIAVLVGLVSTRPTAERTVQEDTGVLVEVVRVETGRQTVKVQAHGTVVPARLVSLSPEVGGKVVWVHPELKPGTRFREGERIVRIDPRDYRLAVEQQLAAVEGALTELEIERGRKKIAEREWQLFEGKKAGEPAAPAEDGSLALREPQLRTAKVSVESARSGLERAKLAVSRTVIAAPFNAMVQSENVELGQMVGPAIPLVTLVGTDAYWVQISVPIDRLSWVAVPGIRGATEGSAAQVVQEVGRGQSITRSGRVIRLLGDVDPAGRMARLLVQIDDPLGLAAPSEGEGAAGMPLLLGSFVEVELDGREVDGVAVLRRDALRDGDEVYLMSPERTLVRRNVSVVWRGTDTVLIDGGLGPDDLVIVSPVPAPVEGMLLRTAGEASAMGAR